MFMSVTLNANDTFTIFLLDNILGLFSECILISVVSKVHQISYCLIREANLTYENDLLFKILIN